MEVTTNELGGTRKYISIEAYAKAKLNGADYDNETVECTAENNSEAIGRLLDVLAKTNIINSEDVMKIIDYYGCRSLKLGE